MTASLPKQVLSQLAHADQTLSKTKVLVGLDGFVDTILHVVDTRESAKKYTRLTKMKEYAARIDAAAGLSRNFELVPQMVKLGGNGPIMANALGSYSTTVTYIGGLGCPHLHPVFEDFGKMARVISVSEPAYTDAIEFEDGKLMCGKLASMSEITWKTLLKHLPESQLQKAFGESALIAMVNWTMIPYMNEILQKFLTAIAPKLKGEKRWMFFDLADPAKRTKSDIEGILKLIAKFQKSFRVILGLNFNESRLIGEVLGLPVPEETFGAVTAHAAAIQKTLKLETVVIHPVSFAAAADANGASYVEGPFTPKPKITTGAGDHFNAGFCIGRLLGFDLPGSLQIGVATSGFYVRNAKSPSVADLRRFLKQLV